MEKNYKMLKLERKTKNIKKAGDWEINPTKARYLFLSCQDVQLNGKLL